MLKGIWSELVLIRQELQAIRGSLESNAVIKVDLREVGRAVQNNVEIHRRYIREPYGRKFIPHPEHDINRSQQKES